MSSHSEQKVLADGTIIKERWRTVRLKLKLPFYTLLFSFSFDRFPKLVVEALEKFMKLKIYKVKIVLH